MGLTSRSGVIPESHNQDTVGAFGRTFRDAVHVLNAIHGYDPRDKYTRAQIGKTPRDYTKFLRTKSSIKGVRFGIPWDRVWNTPTTLNQLPKLFEALEKIKHAGGIIVNNTNLKHPDETVSAFGWDWTWQTDMSNFPQVYPNRSEFTVVSTDFYNDVNKYLSELTNTPIKTLQDVIDFNMATSLENGPAFASGSDNLQRAEDTKGIMNLTYYEALVCFYQLYWSLFFFFSSLFPLHFPLGYRKLIECCYLEIHPHQDPRGRYRLCVGGQGSSPPQASGCIDCSFGSLQSYNASSGNGRIPNGDFPACY